MYKRLPETLTPEEQEKLLAEPNRKCRTGLRNYCMMLLMLDCGLRSAEVLALRFHDIDWKSGRLMVRGTGNGGGGKNGKDRTLWLSDYDLEALRAWRAVRPAGNGLFATLKGKHISARYLRTMIKRESRQAGIEKDVHPHTLRHSFATDLYRETKNILLVQKALGHADLATTMIYTHLIDTDLEEALKKLRR